MYSEEIPNDSKLYHNHESFCLLKNNRVYAFGLEEYGGIIPDNLRNTLSNKNITEVFSTESAFCALDNNKNVYCWGNTSEGGSIPNDVNNEIQGKVEKVFSNKDTFMVIYGENNKLATWGKYKVTLNQVLNTVKVYSNENSIIALYKTSSDELKVKCYASVQTNILNNNNVETKNNVKCVYTNQSSILIIYGNDNKIAVCGNRSYYGDKDTIEAHENVVSVVSNIGAYTILKYDGTIHSFGLSQYRTGFPSSNTNFKNIYSGVGIFVGIKNNNTAVIWGRNTYGYNDTNEEYNIVENVKDVYFNGDDENGSILLVKNDDSNIVLRGTPDFGNNQNIGISSNSVSKVFTNVGAYFIVTTDNKLHVYGKEYYTKGYENPGFTTIWIIYKRLQSRK